MGNDKSTIKEASEKLKLHYQTIRNMINDGRLKAEKSDKGTWLIENSSIRKIYLEYIESTILSEEEEATVKGLKIIEKENQDNALNAALELARISKDYLIYYEGDSLSVGIVQGVANQMKKEIETFEKSMNIVATAKKQQINIKSKELTVSKDFFGEIH